jgi:hypothetical protein
MVRQMTEKIDIRGLKKWCAENYPTRSALNQVLQLEEDELTLNQYKERGMVWLKLSRLE